MSSHSNPTGRQLGRVLLVNAYSYHNAGDAAIMLATRDLLLDLGAEGVTLSSRYDDAREYAVHQLDVVPELIPFPTRRQRGGGMTNVRRAAVAAAYLGGAAIAVQLGRVNQRLGRFIATSLLPATRDLGRDFECLAIAGGGYMYSSRRRLNLSLWHSLATIRLAQLFLGRTVMLPQSIGPLNREADKILVSWALSKTAIVQRETVSLARSRRMPAFASRIVHDVAFYGMRLGSEVAVRRRTVTLSARIVAMDWRWSASVPADAFEAYLNGLARVAKGLLAAGYAVTVGGHSAMPEHDQDDIAVARVVAQRSGSDVPVDENADVAHLTAAYAEADLVIGTRLHACIMALAVGTPAISLAYQEKSKGVMAEAGYADAVFSAAQFDPDEVLACAFTLMRVPIERTLAEADARRREIIDFYREYIASD